MQCQGPFQVDLVFVQNSLDLSYGILFIVLLVLSTNFPTVFLTSYQKKGTPANTGYRFEFQVHYQRNCVCFFSRSYAKCSS